MKSLLHKERWPERVSAFLYCLLVSLIPLALGIIGLGFSERKWMAAILAGFGIATLLSGLAILRNQIWGPKLAAGLLGIETVFLVAIGHDNPGRLFSAFLVLCGAWYFYDYAKKQVDHKKGTTTTRRHNVSS